MHKPILALLLLGSLVSGQNLTNANFEAPWTTNPPGWPVAWNLTATQTANDPAQPLPPAANSPEWIHCGRHGCLLQVPSGSNYADFGKQWDVVSTPAGPAPTGTLAARLHVRYLAAPSTTAVVEAVVGAFDAQWQQLSGTSVATVVPGPDWQEVRLFFNATSLPVGTHIRAMLRMVNAGGAAVYVDDVDFQRTDPSFGTVEPPIGYEVRSSNLLVMLDTLRGAVGEIRHLVGGIPTGPNLIAAADSPLYQFTVQQGQGLTTHSSSADAPFVATSTSGGFLLSPQSPNPAWPTFTVKVIADPTSDAILFQHQAAGSFVVEEVTCPTLQVPTVYGALAPNLGDAQSDHLFLPFGDGVDIHENAWTQDCSFLSWEGTYPGRASMQFLARCDSTQGLMVHCEDTGGETKALGLVRTVYGTWLETKRLLPGDATSSQLLAQWSYPTAISFCAGDWSKAAARYRQWALQQSWSAYGGLGTPPIHPRAAWLRDRPTVLESDLQPQGFGGELVALNRWPSVFDAWRTQLTPAGWGNTGSMLGMFRSFEKGGSYVGPYYTLEVTSETCPSPGTVLHSTQEIASAWSNAQSLGHHNMAMVAALKYALDRTGFGPCCNDPQMLSYWVPPYRDPSFQPATPTTLPSVLASNNLFHDNCVRDRGNTQATIFDPVANWDSFHGTICIGTRFAINTNTAFAQTLAQAGCHVLQLDQMNGGVTPPCYNPAHAHPPGQGAWHTVYLRMFLDALLATGKLSSPDFELALEDPCEQAIPWVTIQGGRPNVVRGWPGVDSEFSRVVPAFQFVYGSRITAITWDMSLFSNWPALYSGTNPAVRADEVQHALVQLGRIAVAGTCMAASIAPWMLVAENSALPVGGLSCGQPPSNPQLIEPDPSRLQADHQRLLLHLVGCTQGPARTFINDGMAQTVEGTVAASLTLFAGDASRQYTHPAVQCAAWRLAGGRTGLLVVNSSNAAARFIWPTRVGGTTPAPLVGVDDYDTGSHQSTPNVAFSSLPTTLNPLQVLFVTW